MSEQTEILHKPHFISQVPEHLIAGKSIDERWLYEQQSIQSQKQDWMIDQLVSGAKKSQELEALTTEHAKAIKALVNYKYYLAGIIVGLTVLWDTIKGSIFGHNK